MVRGLRIDFSRNVAILAKRANTKGSVVVSTMNLLTNKEKSGSLVQCNRGGAIVRKLFDVPRGTGAISILRSCKVRTSKGRILLRQRLSQGNGGVSHIGNAVIAITALHRMNRALVSVRKRGRRRRLVSPRGRVSLLSRFTKGRLERIGAACLGACTGCISAHGRLVGLGASRGRAIREVSLLAFRVRRVRRTRLGSTTRSRGLRRRQGLLIGCRGIVRTLADTCSSVRGDRRGNVSGVNLNVTTLRGIRSVGPICRTVTSSISTTCCRLRRYTNSVLSRVRRLSCSRKHLGRVRGQLRLVHRLGQGCKGAVDRILKRCRGVSRRLSLVRGQRDCLRGLGISCGGTGRRVLTINERLAAVQGGTTAILRRRVRLRLGRLCVSGILFGAIFRRRPKGIRVASGNLSRIRFCVTAGINRPLGTLTGITDNNRLSEVVLTVGTVFAGARNVADVVFSRISANISNEMTRTVTGGVRLITNCSRILYVARLPRITTVTSRRLCVRGRVVTSQAGARIGSLFNTRHVGRITQVLTNASVARLSLTRTGRLLRLTGARGGGTWRGAYTMRRAKEIRRVNVRWGRHT